MAETLRASARSRKKATPFESNAVASSSSFASEFSGASSSSPSHSNDWGDFDGLPTRSRGGAHTRSGAYWKGALAVVVIAILAGAAGYFSTRGVPSLGGAAKAEKFNAIFLNNGQVYFGVIKDENSQYMVLDNVFYLQLVNEEIPATEEGGEPQVVQRPQLVKKGDEYYGPDSSIRLNRAQVAVVEDLRDDSDILRQIKERLSLPAPQQ